MGYRKLCSIVGVSVSVCVPKTKDGKNVLGQGLREILCLTSEGVAGGRMKLHSVQMHELYW